MTTDEALHILLQARLSIAEYEAVLKVVGELKILEILKNHIYIDNDIAVDNFSMHFYHTAYNGTEFNKVKEWLEDNEITRIKN